MTKEQFIKEIEHIAGSGSNEIRLGKLFDVVINEAIEDCQETLNDEVKTNERLTEYINKELTDFSSQESKRAVDEFKEKLKKRILSVSDSLYTSADHLKLSDYLNALIDKL